MPGQSHNVKFLLIGQICMVQCLKMFDPAERYPLICLNILKIPQKYGRCFLWCLQLIACFIWAALLYLTTVNQPGLIRASETGSQKEIC